MASRIQGITVEIGGDTTKLGNALKDVNSKTKSLQTELKGVNTLLKMDPSNVTLLKQKQDLLNQSIAECKEKLTMLKSTQSQVQEQFEKGEITEEQYRDFQREIVATENKLKSLENQAKSFGSVGAQQVAAVGEKMKGIGGSIENAGKKFSVVSAGVAAIGAASISAFNEVDKGADTAVKATGAVGEQAESIRNSYKNVASTVKGEFSDIGAALGEVNTRFGFTGEELEKCTTQFIKFGEVTGADVTTAVQKVSRYMGDASIDSREYNTVLDNLTVACQASGISMDTLTDTLVKYGAPMRALGFETQEAIAIFSQWEKAGVNTEIAFSGMKTAISKWSAEGLDAKEKFKQTLEEIKKCPDIASATTKAIEAFGKKAGPDLADAIKGGRFEYEDFLQLLQNSQGQLDGTYDEVVDGADDAKVAMQNLKIALSEIGGIIMEMVAPIFQALSEKLKAFKEWWSNLNPAIQKFIVIVGGIIVALGPVLIFIGKITSSLGSILTYGPKIVNAFSTIKTAIMPAITGIKTAISGLFSVIMAHPVVLVITAIIAAIILLWNKCEWFRNLVIGIFNAIKDALAAAWEGIKAVWDFVQPYFAALWEGIKQVFSVVATVLGGFFSAAWEAIKVVWDFVVAYFSAIWEGIKLVFSVVSTVLGGFFSVAWEVIKTVWDVAVQYFSMIWENIKIVFSVVADTLGGFFRMAWEIIKAVWDTVAGYFSAVWETIKGIFSVVTSVLHGDFSGAWEAIKGVVNTWAGFFSNVWNNIKNIFSSVASFFSNTFQSAWNGIKSIFSNVTGFFQNIWNTIKNMFSNIGTAIGNGIGNAFRTVVNSIISFAQNTINGFIRAINGAIGLINKIPGVNIGKIRELSIPRLKVGMANVPYDDYLALLHKGERVLTAKENREYGKEKNSSSNITNNENNTILKIEKFYNNREQDIQGIAEELAFYEQKYAMAKGG